MAIPDPLFAAGTIVRPAGLDSHVTLGKPWRDPPSTMYPQGTWIYPCTGTLATVVENYVAEIISVPTGLSL